MRVLSEWQPDLDVVLHPGDMLYVPPHCGHEGVALTAGQTLSIGFLAPRHDELVASFLADAVGAAGDGRYTATQQHVRSLLFLADAAAAAAHEHVRSLSANSWQLSEMRHGRQLALYNTCYGRQLAAVTTQGYDHKTPIRSSFERRARATAGSCRLSEMC